MIDKNRLQYFYDRFFINRIGVRTLIYQHSKIVQNFPRWIIDHKIFFFSALLFGQEITQPNSQQAGIIDAAVDVVKVVQGKFLILFLWSTSKGATSLMKKKKSKDAMCLQSI